MNEVSELLLIDKPAGITSFGLIRELRRKLGVKKMGHAGTLDPLATGLMIIGVGKGTKRLTGLVKLDKEYVAEILVGEKRSTGDMEGDVVKEKEVDEIFSDEKISSTLASMVGTLTLPVSAYSAIKRDGVPMYKRARKAEKEGKRVSDADLPVRDMKVYAAELLGLESGAKPVIKVRFTVGSGTYIRSLAEEFGRRLSDTSKPAALVARAITDLEKFLHLPHFSFTTRLKQALYRSGGAGYPATLKSLRRTKVGEFDIRNAKTLDEF